MPEIGNQVKRIATVVHSIKSGVANYEDCDPRKKNLDQHLQKLPCSSRVDLFLPLDTKINVSLNQKVKGAEDIIAKV